MAAAPKDAPKPRIKVPATAKQGEVITIRTLVNHAMESGQRKDQDGNLVPRRILNRFRCEFAGRLVFGCDLETGITANPYLEFRARVSQSGTFRFTWVDDDGSVIAAEERITVT
ncbi:MAG: thiosulfate oxidation carrier complex protein SoxZ [Alphaproteobacteria bacterium]|nr:thiosulfate oxidation carrier complex protein SoxZ [Alphaproteobacteria bacterium]